MPAPVDFIHRAYTFYLALGYTPAGAAAMASNATVESNGNPTITGDGGKSLGIFQWHPDRQAELQKFASSHNLDPAAENTQLGFADWELRNTEKDAGKEVINADSTKAANNGMMKYLRPAGYTPDKPDGVPSYGARLEGADQILSQPWSDSPDQFFDTKQAPQVPQGGTPQGYDFANLSGPYGGLGNTPAPNAAAVAQMQGAGAKPFNYAGATQQGLGLMAAGSQDPRPAWMQQAMAGGGMKPPVQNRPQAQGMGGMPTMGMPPVNSMPGQLAGLLSDPSMDPQKKQMLMGLLGS